MVRTTHAWCRVPGITLIWVALALSACGSPGQAAYLPQPSPVPTLARLPTTTPAPPTPVVSPTPTAARATATPVEEDPVQGVVTTAANVRSGPGVSYAIIGWQDQGGEVLLLAESEGWYRVELPDGRRGWMAGQLLDIDEAAIIPTAEISD